MSIAAIDAHDLLPRRPGGMAPGGLLSLLVHAGLIAALSYGVGWRSPPPDVVSAELWAAVPQAAAPRAVEPTPAPAPPQVKATPPPAAPAPAPAAPDPQIAIAKAKKEQAAKAEREAEARAQAEREKELRAKAEREEAERRQRAQEAAEELRLAKQREENLKRMMGQITSAAGGRGSAAADAAPSASYAGRLVQVIKPNIVLTDTIAGNPAAEVEVRSAPNGTIISRQVLRSSGSKEWDDAVLRAIDRTGTLPRDVDGRVPASLVITFRPRD